jgi:hypothetical protein
MGHAVQERIKSYARALIKVVHPVRHMNASCCIPQGSGALADCPSEVTSESKQAAWYWQGLGRVFD